MAFALDARDVPTILDHADAARVYATLAEFPARHKRRTHPGHGDGCDMREARPLTKSARNLGHMSLRQTCDGDWIARYHSTDLVTYHKDGSVTLRPWASKSTNNVCNAVLPADLRTDYGDREHVVWCQSRPGTYAVNQSWRDEQPRMSAPAPRIWSDDFTGWVIAGAVRFAVDPDTGWWGPVDPTDCVAVERPFVDRAKAREALKPYRLSDFTAWTRAYLAMGGDLPTTGREHDVATLLPDPARWPEALALVEHLGIKKANPWAGWRTRRDGEGDFSPAKFRDALRVHLCGRLGLVETETFDCYRNLSHRRAVERAQAKWA